MRHCGSKPARYSWQCIAPKTQHKNILHPRPRNNAPKMHCTIVITPTRHQQRWLCIAYQMSGCKIMWWSRPREEEETRWNPHFYLFVRVKASCESLNHVKGDGFQIDFKTLGLRSLLLRKARWMFIPGWIGRVFPPVPVQYISLSVSVTNLTQERG